MARPLRIFFGLAVLGGAAAASVLVARGDLTSEHLRPLKDAYWSARKWVEGTAGASGTFWCPMDPEIIRKGIGMCPICNMELVPFEGGNADGMGESGVLVLTDRQVQQTGVRLDSVATRDLVRVIDTTGRLEVNPTYRSTLLMGYPGESVIERVHVHAAGLDVNENEVLLEVTNESMFALLEEYRTVIQEVGRLKAARRDAEASVYLRRMKELKDEVVSYGLPTANLSLLASAPKNLFTTPRFPVIARASGTVLSEPKLVEGGRLMKNAPLVEVADLTKLWLYVDLYEHERPLVDVDQEIRFTTMAVPDQVFNAQVQFIEPFVHERTQTVRARARVSNPRRLLAPGMFVRAEIRSAAPYVLSVPESAVLQSGRRNVVLVSEGGGRFRPRLVQVGRRHLSLAKPDDQSEVFASTDERYHEILDGLKEGERVVVAGNFLLNAEAQFQGILKKMIDAAEREANAAEVSEAARGAFDTALSEYVAIGDLLVLDEPDGLARRAEDLARVSEAAVESGGALAQRFKGIGESASELAALAKKPELDWTAIRTAYGSMSRDVVLALRDTMPTRVSEGELFLFRCPMAEDFGYDLWVQADDQLENPYMGQWMVECGMAAELE